MFSSFYLDRGNSFSDSSVPFFGQFQFRSFLMWRHDDGWVSGRVSNNSNPIEFRASKQSCEQDASIDSSSSPSGEELPFPGMDVTSSKKIQKEFRRFCEQNVKLNTFVNRIKNIYWRWLVFQTCLHSTEKLG